jgi:septum site-determining protein MinC
MEQLGIGMKQSSATRKRRATGSRRRSAKRPPDLSVMCKSELAAFMSALQTQAQPGCQAAEGLPIASSSVQDPTLAHAPKPVRPPCLFIDESVRSGQVIEFPDGDVTVIGSVGSGAEIIAGGSIHIYGTLRGRALAGTKGDATARIFCRRFQAELLAIDGRYRVADNAELRGRAVQARLEGMGMTLKPLD